jgi:hypothetical protein
MTHTQSGRFDGDSWDPASSVGATATIPSPTHWCVQWA